MAKKILSILCALAMMVTMVSVAAFSVSAAEEGYADFDGLADMTLYVDSTGEYNNTSGYYARVGSGLYDSAYLGGKALLADQGLLSLSSDEYAIDDEFSMTYYLQRKRYDGGNGTGKDGSVAHGFLNRMVLGDLVVELTSDNQPYITCTVTYDGEQLAAYTPSAWGYWTDIAAGSADHTTILDEMNDTYADGDYDSAGDRMKVQVNITYSNGALTVSYGQVGNVAKQHVVTASIDNADFSAAAMELTIAENKNKGSHLYGFTGTYKTVSTGGEGGDEPDQPDVPDEPVGESGNFDGIADMTITKDAAYYNSAWYTDVATGRYTSSHFGSDVLFATQSRIVAASADKYNVGDEFSVKYYITQSKGGKPHDGIKYGHMNEFRLGDLYILLTAPNSPEISCSVSYKGTELATATGGYSHSTDVAAGSEEHTAIQTEFNTQFSNNAGAFGTNENRIKFEVNITYKNGQLTVVYGAIDNPAKQSSVVADIANADFSNAAMELSVGELNNDGIALYGFSGTYSLPVDEDDDTDPLAPTGVYPTLNSDLTLNVIYANAEDYKDTVQVTATVGGESQTVSLTEKGGNLVASFDFLTPDQFGSTITLVATDTNGVAETNTTEYSVKQYCKNMMDNANYGIELKQLCMALLQFGDSVAVYNGDSSFLSDMSSYASTYAPTAWTAGTADWSYTGNATGAAWVGANLNFADEIGINVYFTADGDASDYTVDVDDSFGTASDVIVDGNYFMATIRISSSFLSTQSEVTVMDANGVASKVFTLSVEDWVNANIGNMDDAEKACATALMTYGDAAVAYGNTL